MKKIYEEDSCCRSILTRVTAVEYIENETKVELEASVLFPGGGGQGRDYGTIGGVPVVDAAEKDGRVTYTVAGRLQVGDEVRVEIDWARRFDMMQNHTAEHVISAELHRLYGASSVGFHLNDEFFTLDIDVPLTEEQVKEAELASNERLWENHPVKMWYPDEEEMETITLRKLMDRVEGPIRVVHIDGVDTTACCAPHVKWSAQAAPLKVLKAEKYKGGMRFTMVAGKRAFLDHEEKQSLLNRISKTLSAKLPDTADKTEKLLAEKNDWKRKYMELNKERLKGILRSLRETAPKAGDVSAIGYLGEMGADEVKTALFAALEGEKTAALIFGMGSGRIFYQAGLSDDAPGDLRPMVKELNAKTGGKGGGQPKLLSGSMEDTPENRSICESFVNELPRFVLGA